MCVILLVMFFLDFSDCTSDIIFFAERYDPSTRNWFVNDFNSWFNDSGNSRAYVLLGDAGVGKSVMAAVIAQRARNDGNLAAAYFCHHDDGTRRDPRYLLGTVAYQLRNCNSQYDRIVGGEIRIQNILANAKLGVKELFTKLLQEPLSKCSPTAKKLVVIDALDEAEYSSREDFLDVIMNRFPMLPKWLVFFITSRPEDTVQFRLKTYNPCIRICAGSSEGADFYQQHKRDIQRFLENKVNFQGLSYTAEELAEKCNGMFLHAFFIAEMLQNSAQMDVDTLPENLNDFLLQNFERIEVKIGEILCRRLFGCALVAPSPLPISFISFLLQKENSSLREQQVIDAVSLFVALRTSDQTFAFLHNLIPDWLKDKKKSREFFINKNIATEYFRSIIDGLLNDFLEAGSIHLFCDEPDSVNYVLMDGFRFLCQSVVKDSGDSETVFKCLTNYRFLQQRIQSSKIGIYSVLGDLKFSAENIVFDPSRKNIFEEIRLVLERDLLIVAYCPELLDSCLRNASTLVQEQIIPKEVSTCVMESDRFCLSPFLRSMQCGAFSSNNLLAVGNKQDMSLYNVCPFTKILGPIELMNEDISHLTFSPDNKFLFFGKLDLWFSVEKRRVVKMPRFSGNSKRYEWSSFIYEGKYIAVCGKLNETHSNECLFHLFSIWIAQEWQDKPFAGSIVHETDLACSILVGLILRNRPHTLPDIIGKESRILSKLCPLCSELERLETPVRDRVLRLYADIFECQIWNLDTGRSVLEEMFSMQSDHDRFFFLWHLFPSLKERVVEKHIFFVQDAAGDLKSYFRYIFFKHLRKIYQLVEELFLPEFTELHTYFEEYMRWNIPVECEGYMFGAKKFSVDLKWSVSRGTCKENIELISLRPSSGRRKHCLENVQKYAFSNDSKLLLYITSFPNQNLHAFCLETGVKLHSISGFLPISFTRENTQCVGYAFSEYRRDLRKIKDVLFSELQPKLNAFLFYCITFVTPTNSINVAFDSSDAIICVSSGGMRTKLRVLNSEVVQVVDAKILMDNDSQPVSLNKCIFSHDGELIAIHQGCEISMFRNGDKCLSSVFKTSEEKCTVACVTFSRDDSLLLFCVENAKNDQIFYVFDVKNEGLNGPVVLSSPPYNLKIPVDSFCFSSDSSQLFFCNALFVFILQFPIEFLRCRTLTLPNGYFTPFDICGYCTVSSDNTFLACCINNKILIHALNSQDGFWELPQNHIGKIERCEFLKDNRYLISYGIDGLIFLFDLCEWKSIAYVKQESIISIAVSPDEDKIVCLQSSGKMSVVNLRGLGMGLPSNFQLPSKYRVLPKKKRQPVTSTESRYTCFPIKTI